jgi:hypothetical protein
MTLEELQNRMTLIGEDCGDLEVDFYKVYNLYLDVLIAIANRQCEGASSREFAKEAIQMELSMYDILSAVEFPMSSGQRLAVVLVVRPFVLGWGNVPQ